jgi:molecular chaperone DnaJ
LKHLLPDHYATLGLHRRCNSAQIRDAYRILAKQHHPDLNAGSAAAVAQTQALNAAYKVLSEESSRRAYDEAWAAEERGPKIARASKAVQNLAQDVTLRIPDFFRGATLAVGVNDSGNPHGPESYPLEVPPMTAPGTKFRVPRTASTAGGHVMVRIRAQADFRFKPRGSDLRCDLRISHQRATQGGEEMVNGPTGSRIRVKIPARVSAKEVLRVAGEGLPKARGGRGDLLVRIIYRPEVSVRRKAVVG